LGQVGGVQTQLQRMAATGLDVAITELDIRIEKPVTDAKLTQQQNDYNTVTKACLNTPKCVGITVWGVSDKVRAFTEIFTNNLADFFSTLGLTAHSLASMHPFFGTITLTERRPTLASTRLLTEESACCEHVRPLQVCCARVVFI